MKKTFKEYHQFNDDEFKKMWEECLFVFDTNVLLNMYRYSRETAEEYLKVLDELKSKKQLWMPYQVGYEFYENRVNVISRYEKSYDEILKLIEDTKGDIQKKYEWIQQKYRNHPFIDFAEINLKGEVSKWLEGVEKKVEELKKDHPKWLVKDDILEKLNKLYENNIGNVYDENRIKEIKKEGRERYDKKVPIPPGFDDDTKEKQAEDKEFGDLIIWFQIIEKAKETGKPIIFITWDVKKDWWLMRDKEKLMPLPQLKKEMTSKANVDFHMYTADQFLKYYTSWVKKVDADTIKEVREVRESLEEEAIMMSLSLYDNNYLKKSLYVEYINLYDITLDLLNSVMNHDISLSLKDELINIHDRLIKLRHKDHDVTKSNIMEWMYVYIKQALFVLNKYIYLDATAPIELITIYENINITNKKLGRKFKMIQERDDSPDDGLF